MKQSIPAYVGGHTVRQARALMRQGLSMHGAAQHLNVRRDALDLALWRNIDVDDEDLTPNQRPWPTPMF